MNTCDTFREIFDVLFNEIMKVEEKAIITGDFKDITTNDVRVIDAIGIETEKNMSAVAKSLSVTTGTLTISVNNLVKKGYVQRARSETDRRVVLISLTARGKAAFLRHQEFQDELIRSALAGLNDTETQLLAQSLSQLIDFFKNYPASGQ